MGSESTSRQLEIDRPALVVIFELERTRPRIYFALNDERDLERLRQWLTTRPDLGELAVAAVDLFARDEQPGL